MNIIVRGSRGETLGEVTIQEIAASPYFILIDRGGMASTATVDGKLFDLAPTPVAGGDTLRLEVP